MSTLLAKIDTRAKAFKTKRSLNFFSTCQEKRPDLASLNVFGMPTSKYVLENHTEKTTGNAKLHGKDIVLAENSFATVKLGRSRDTGAKVAVRVIPLRKRSDIQRVQRDIIEALNAQEAYEKNGDGTTLPPLVNLEDVMIDEKKDKIYFVQEYGEQLLYNFTF